jgi:hypothetical protein
MSQRPPTSVSRRQFLVGGSAAAGAVLLGACGSDASGGGDAPPTTGSDGGLALVQFFGGLPMLVAGREVRAPFGLADSDGLLPVEGTPPSVAVSILGPRGDTVVEPVEVARHGDGLPRAYYPLLFTVGEPGVYTGRTEVDGEVLEMAIKVDAAADVAVIQPGATMPALVTPTPDDPQGVDPICTNDPMCALHDVTVADALGEGRPLALLVAAPGFCKVAICGPVLDVLLGVVDAHRSVRFLHAEVYVHPQDNLNDRAPVLDALGLEFEPCLVLVGSDGRVVERLDTIYDTAELNAVLARLT